jgi:hypothetical protein
VRTDNEITAFDNSDADGTRGNDVSRQKENERNQPIVPRSLRQEAQSDENGATGQDEGLAESGDGVDALEEHSVDGSANRVEAIIENADSGASRNDDDDPVVGGKARRLHKRAEIDRDLKDFLTLLATKPVYDVDWNRVLVIKE